MCENDTYVEVGKGSAGQRLHYLSHLPETHRTMNKAPKYTIVSTSSQKAQKVKISSQEKILKCKGSEGTAEVSNCISTPLLLTISIRTVLFLIIHQIFIQHI